jgi:C-terminal processing protease CtpA/Prc
LYSLPTIDYDYNRTDAFSLSDAGGTIGSQSLSTTIFGAQTRGSSLHENQFILERGLYGNTTSNDPYFRKNTMQQHHPIQPKQTLLEIYAPPGKLGVVIDVPANSTTPVVHAIKDNCPIRNEINVGDQLLAVDEEDVRNMTAVEVSRLISRKSLQQARKLTVLRSERRNEFGL